MALKISDDERARLKSENVAAEFTATGRVRRSRANGYALRLIAAWRQAECEALQGHVSTEVPAFGGNDE